MTGEEFNALHHRRLFLIEKQLTIGLTPREEKELNESDARVDAYTEGMIMARRQGVWGTICPKCFRIIVKPHDLGDLCSKCQKERGKRKSNAVTRQRDGRL